MLRYFSRFVGICIFAACLCFSNTSDGFNFIAYRRHVLQAEEALSRSEIGAAVLSYRQAFDGVPHVFARDAYNACQLAALDSSEHFGLFYALCARSGVSRSLLNRNRLIQGRVLQDSLRYHAIYAEGRTQYRKRIDTALRAEFSGRFQLEQSYKGKPGYREVCSDNFNRILLLTQQGRYPGEDLIGPDEELEDYYVRATLLHYPYSYVLLQEQLLQGLAEGKVQPGMLLYLYGFNQTRNSVLYTPNIPVDSTHFLVCYNTPFGKQSEDTAAVNRARAAFYVPSLQASRLRILVAKKYGIDFR